MHRYQEGVARPLEEGLKLAEGENLTPVVASFATTV